MKKLASDSDEEKNDKKEKKEKKSKKEKKEKSDSESEEVPQKKVSNKYSSYLNSDGEFLGWKKTARKVILDKGGEMKKKKMLKKIWKIYQNST